MSKIGDFEQRLISDGMTDRDLEEYAKLLVRVSIAIPQPSSSLRSAASRL